MTLPSLSVQFDGEWICSGCFLIRRRRVRWLMVNVCYRFPDYNHRYRYNRRAGLRSCTSGGNGTNRRRSIFHAVRSHHTCWRCVMALKISCIPFTGNFHSPSNVDMRMTAHPFLLGEGVESYSFDYYPGG